MNLNLKKLKIIIKKMIFEESISVKNIGSKIGYISSYLIFTVFLFLISNLLNDSHVHYLVLASITLILAIFGILFRRILR